MKFWLELLIFKNMPKQVPKNYCIFLTAIAILVLVLIWYYSQAVVSEISRLTGNISILVALPAEVLSTPDDALVDEAEPIVCSQPRLDISSAGYYYSPQGDQLGVGPIPPMIDVQTNYWIFWEVTGFSENLKNLEISAQLPDKVVWTNDKTVLAGDLQFGQASQRIVWIVDEIKKNQGIYKIGFEVGLIPTEQDLNKILNLLTNIQYQAIDAFCGEKISGSLDNITTNLIFDNLAKNKGEVVPFK